MSEGNIPSIDDFLDKSNNDPSIDNIMENSELPSIENFKEKKEVIEEEIKTDNWKDNYIPDEIETVDIIKAPQWAELVRMVNDVRESIPDIPEIKYYDDELKQISEQIKEVQRNIPEVPEVKYYDDEIKLIKEDLNEYKSSAFPNFLGKLFEGIKSSVDTDIDLIKEDIAVINFEKKIIEGNLKNTKNNVDESIDNIKKEIDKELSESATRIYELKLHLKDDDRKLKKQLLGQYNLLKENIEKTVEDFNQKNIEVQNITTSSLKEYFDEIKKSIDELPEVKYYDRQIIELRKEVKEIESLKTIVEELKTKQSLLNENVIDAPPSEGNSDPLTPLDQNFVTLDELQDHYRLFVNRIQQQLSSLGGGGEVRVLRMDDVDTTDLGDEKVLSYDASTEKLKFVDQSGGSGVSTANVRTGILDVAGIATFRSNTLVGTGVTLSPDGDIFATGVTTSTTFSGSGANLTNLPAANLTGALPAISGANLTGIAATANVRTGILDVAGIATFRNDIIIGSGVTLSPDGDIFATGVTTAMNSITLKSDDGTPGRIDLYCESNNAHYARIQAPAHSDFGGNITLTLPSSTGTLLTSVGTSNIDDDAVTEAKLANAINTAIAANTAKTTNATHTGEVTGSTALTIADNVVDEANLKVSNSPTDGYFLSAQSGNTGGLTWAAASGGGFSQDSDGNLVAGTNAGEDLASGGTYNILIGEDAGKELTTQDNNIYIGKQAGENAVHSYGANVAIGYQSLQAGNQAGSTHSVSIGYQAGYYKPKFAGCTFVGYQAGAAYMSSSQEAHHQTFIGQSSGYNSKLGRSVAVGSNALYQGNYIFDGQCTAAGWQAGYSNTSGKYNTYIGSKSGYTVTSGEKNTIIGRMAGGTTLSTGDNNIVIGHEADTSTSSVDNEITLGNSDTATLRCNTQTISSLSDKRDKTDINQLDLGLDFVDSLKPVKFKWQTRDGNGKDGSYEHGFIAQDLQKIQKDNDADYLGLVMDENPERLEASYGKLVPVLVKAIQELKQEIKELKKQ